jgi:hypothetical protein
MDSKYVIVSVKILDVSKNWIVIYRDKLCCLEVMTQFNSFKDKDGLSSFQILFF